uniref:Uncharacterized protein n=1 Tax=Physcomitrium patens TaxID=3218 RepID=A0A7I3ZID7_PHYPA
MSVFLLAVVFESSTGRGLLRVFSMCLCVYFSLLLRTETLIFEVGVMTESAKTVIPVRKIVWIHHRF